MCIPSKNKELLITRDLILHNFIYDKEKGKLYNSKNRGHKSTFLKESGVIGKDNYRRVWIGTNLFLVHRLIWVIENNYWPKNTVDHIDGNRLNNTIYNLQEKTQKQNCSNRIEHRNGVHLGVRFIKKLNKFVARNSCKNFITGKHFEVYLGLFNTEKEAIEARLLSEPYFI